MINQEEIEKLRKRLLERHKEVFDLYHGLNESSQRLQQVEMEMEEEAEKKKLSDRLDRLRERQLRELEDIDLALKKIQLGGYGQCESCGSFISLERLKAIPWVRMCSECEAETHSPPREDELWAAQRAHLPAEYQGWSDLELKEAVLDELRKDGRVELDELSIYFRDGVLFLAGVLPSETKREILLEIVQDIMGLQNVVDSIRIDRQPWQRFDRKPVSEQTGSESPDVIQALKEGVPLPPPDKIEPES